MTDGTKYACSVPYVVDTLVPDVKLCSKCNKCLLVNYGNVNCLVCVGNFCVHTLASLKTSCKDTVFLSLFVGGL